MITKIKPDKQKSESLKKIAEITLERLYRTNMESYPTNTLIDYYDILHKLMEALTLKNGVKIKGEGAHQELIDYLAKQHIFDEQTRGFLQQVRDYRNRISYEGFRINKNYIILNKKIIINVMNKLFDKLKA